VNLTPSTEAESASGSGDEMHQLNPRFARITVTSSSVIEQEIHEAMNKPRRKYTRASEQKKNDPKYKEGCRKNSDAVRRCRVRKNILDKKKDAYIQNLELHIESLREIIKYYRETYNSNVQHPEIPDFPCKEF